MKEHLFDKRVVNRALQEGLLDKAVYQRMLDDLPDLSHKIQTASPVEESSARPSSAPPPSPEPLPAHGLGPMSNEL